MRFTGVFVGLMCLIASVANAVTMTQLTSGGSDYEPRFSPISNDVIYSAGSIYQVTAPSGIPMLAVDHPSSYAPAWFPDGQRIVYNNQSNGCELYIREIDGSIHQLTFNGGRNDDPVVTLDSQWIYFVRNKFSNGQIWRIHPDGTGQEQVISGSSSYLTPSISPDGTTLYYSSNQNGSYQIWRSDLTGSNQVQITPNDGYHKFSPSLSPSGPWIVFTSDAAGLFPNGGNTGIWLCRPDGTGIFKITDQHLGNCSNATWSSDGSMIVFEGYNQGYYLYLLTNLDSPVLTAKTSWGQLKAHYH